MHRRFFSDEKQPVQHTSVHQCRRYGSCFRILKGKKKDSRTPERNFKEIDVYRNGTQSDWAVVHSSLFWRVGRMYVLKLAVKGLTSSSQGGNFSWKGNCRNTWRRWPESRAIVASGGEKSNIFNSARLSVIYFDQWISPNHMFPFHFVWDKFRPYLCPGAGLIQLLIHSLHTRRLTNGILRSEPAKTSRKENAHRHTLTWNAHSLQRQRKAP